jgi:hypothetical protein
MDDPLFETGRGERMSALTPLRNFVEPMKLPVSFQ